MKHQLWSENEIQHGKICHFVHSVNMLVRNTQMNKLTVSPGFRECLEICKRLTTSILVFVAIRYMAIFVRISYIGVDVMSCMNNCIHTVLFGCNYLPMFWIKCWSNYSLLVKEVLWFADIWSALSVYKTLQGRQGSRKTKLSTHWDFLYWWWVTSVPKYFLVIFRKK